MALLEKLQWVKATNHLTGQAIGAAEYSSYNNYVYRKLDSKYYRCLYADAMRFSKWYSIPETMWERCSEYGLPLVNCDRCKNAHTSNCKHNELPCECGGFK